MQSNQQAMFHKQIGNRLAWRMGGKDFQILSRGLKQSSNQSQQNQTKMKYKHTITYPKQTKNQRQAI